MTQTARQSPPDAAGATADRKPALKVAEAPAKPAVRAPVGRRRFRARHHGIWLSFLFAALLPALASIHYLYTRAADQYASTVAFSVRTEEISSPLDFLGGLGQISGTSSSDTDILFEFIQSQEMVARADAVLDLRSIWSSDSDPVFSFDPAEPLEELVKYWRKMVQLAYDPGTGLIEVEVRAFTPDTATAISEHVLAESSDLINRLSKIARDDAIRFAEQERDRASARLKEARLALTGFRNETQIVDPTASLAARSGVVAALEQQLAEALIENDLLIGVTQTNDPRLDQNARRVEAIEARIAAEREKIGRGSGSTGGDVLTDIVGAYEGLLVDREFAEQSYIAALSTYDQAVAEARRQSRYLAAHIHPTLAMSAQYPDRMLLSALTAALLMLGWSMITLVLYSIRDRG